MTIWEITGNRNAPHSIIKLYINTLHQSIPAAGRKVYGIFHDAFRSVSTAFRTARPTAKRAKNPSKNSRKGN